MTRLLTFGHGTASQQDMAALLRGAGVVRLVDIRRYPGSRAHPHVARDTLAQWLPAAGIGYGWEPRLGGRRRVPPDSPDTWWEVAAFRAYAGHMRTPEFQAGIDQLLAGAATVPTAVMCSETVWWRCHRRLVADFVVLVREIPVLHLAHDGRLSEHPPAAGARVVDGGLLYDGPA